MVIQDIPDVGAEGMPRTVQGVAAVTEGSLGDGAPEYCFVTGTVVTNPRTGKTANFAAALPAKPRWNGKFMFIGCGGNCGVVFLGKPSATALLRGYPLFATDDGHVSVGPLANSQGGASETSWAASSGHRNEETTTDFLYRAVHAVVVAGKALTQKFYAAPNLHYAYYQGCSDGGREGMVEVARYPTDFDGVIAGDPYFDIGAEIVNSLVGIQVQLRSSQAALTRAQWSQIDHIVYATCDAADGVSDGLIQNPARCAFDPQRDLPKCAAKADENCFTPDQISSVSAIVSAVTDGAGTVVYPGYPVSDLNNAEAHTDNLAYWLGIDSPPSSLSGPEPWGNSPAKQPQAWYWATQTIRYLIYSDAPSFNPLTTPGIYFRGGEAGSERFHAVVPGPTLALLQKNSAAGNGDDPAASREFFREGHKLILYHGFSDGDITPFRTIQYYRALAKLHGGYAALQKHARLFMVPGMAHCGGGPGPNSFGQIFAPSAAQQEGDILLALENWVEKGNAPQSIVATKLDHDDPKGAALRTMPLCAFPAMARYTGAGDVNVAANWSCSAHDQRLLDIGPAGHRTGVDAPLNLSAGIAVKSGSS
jgi:feruloyl esterase